MKEELKQRMITDVTNYLKVTAPNKESFELRMTHIKEMTKLLEEGSINPRMNNDVFLTAIIFHDVCKFSDKKNHDKASANFLRQWNIFNNSLDNIDLDGALYLIEHHSEKDLVDEDTDINLVMFMDLDILSKFTKRYVEKMIELYSGVVDPINIINNRLNTLEKKRAKKRISYNANYIYSNILSELKYIFEYNVDKQNYKKCFINDKMITRIAYKIGVVPAVVREVLKEEYLI